MLTRSNPPITSARAKTANSRKPFTRRECARGSISAAAKEHFMTIDVHTHYFPGPVADMFRDRTKAP